MGQGGKGPALPLARGLYLRVRLRALHPSYHLSRFPLPRPWFSHPTSASPSRSEKGSAPVAVGVIMSIQDEAPKNGATMSPRLPLLIPSGLVHVYFVAPSVKTNEGTVERTSIYFTLEHDGDKLPRGSKVKFMAKDPAIREDLIALGKRSDLGSVNEEFSWAKGGALTIRVMARA